MNDQEIITMAFDLLDSGDVVNEFDEFVVVHFDREQWNQFWSTTHETGDQA